MWAVSGLHGSDWGLVDNHSIEYGKQRGNSIQRREMLFIMFGMCEDVTPGSDDRLQIRTVYELERDDVCTQ